jgi:hypothetical protein
MHFEELPEDLRGRCVEAQVPWRSDDEVLHGIGAPAEDPTDDGGNGMFRSLHGWIIRAGLWQSSAANRPWAEALLAMGPPSHSPDEAGAGFGSHWWPRSERVPRIDYFDATYQRIVRAVMDAGQGTRIDQK